MSTLSYIPHSNTVLVSGLVTGEVIKRIYAFPCSKEVTSEIRRMSYAAHLLHKVKLLMDCSPS